MKKRVLSLTLALIMCLSLFPATALAGPAVLDSEISAKSESATYHYEVRFEGNGWTSGQLPAPLVADTDDPNYRFAVPQPENLFRDGYAFDYWYEPEEPDIYYYPELGDQIIMDSARPVRTLYAEWEKVYKLAVTFESEGAIPGTVPEGFYLDAEMENSRYIYNLTVPEKLPEWDGKFFLGWKLPDGFCTDPDIPELLQPGEQYKLRYEFLDFTAGDATLTAQWEPSPEGRPTKEIPFVAPEAEEDTVPEFRVIYQNDEGEFLFTIDTEPIPKRENFFLAGYELCRNGQKVAVYQPGDEVILPQPDGKYELVALWRLSDVDTPTMTVSNDPSTGKPVLKWSAVEYAATYTVYYANSSNGYYDVAKETDRTSYTDYEAIPGEKRYYYVIAFSEEGVRSLPTDTQSCVCRCEQPHVTVSKNEDGMPVLSWQKISGAGRYEIQCSKNGQNFYTLDTVTGTQLTHDSAVPGNTYTYQVRAIASKSEADSVWSKRVAMQVEKQELSAPILKVTSKASTGKPVVSWSKVDGAESYEVYRKVGEDGTFEAFYTTTGTRVTNGSAEVGTAYYYQVRAVAADGTRSEFSDVHYRTCDCARPVVDLTTRSDGKPVLTWRKIEGAVKYEVYRSTNGADYAFLSKVSGTKLTNSSAKDGETYRYRVRALASRSAANSAWFTTDSITVKLPTLGVPQLQVWNKASTGKPVLQWTRVAGAEKYEVYRATSEDGPYSRLYTSSGTKLTNGSAKAGTSYYYKVRAVGADGTRGKFCEAEKRTCDLPRPEVTLITRNGHPYLYWKYISGAVNYDVYCSADGGDFTRLLRVKGTTLTHSSAESGHTYCYKVRARASRSAAHSAWYYTDSITVK